MERFNARANEPSTSWRLLALGLVAAMVVPIGIHTVLLDVIGVPYPEGFPKSGWSVLPDQVLRVTAMFYLDTALQTPRGRHWSLRMSMSFLLVAALNEDLLRLPVMRNAVSTRWTIYPFVDNLPQVAKYIGLATLVVMIGPHLKRLRSRIAAGAAISVIMTFTLIPLLSAAFAPLLKADSAKEGDQLYSVPYDWHVDLPSYLTFAEPALAALMIAGLLARTRRSWTSISLMVFCLRAGPLLGVPLNILYSRSSPGLAMLSKGQFSLESLALAIIAASTLSNARSTRQPSE